MAKHVFLKAIYFERNLQTGDMEVFVDSNHGTFVLREDVLDLDVIHSVIGYIKEKATEVISLHVAEQIQSELEKSSLDRAKDALTKIEDKEG